MTGGLSSKVVVDTGLTVFEVCYVAMENRDNPVCDFVQIFTFILNLNTFSNGRRAHLLSKIDFNLLRLTRTFKLMDVGSHFNRDNKLEPYCCHTTRVLLVSAQIKWPEFLKNGAKFKTFNLFFSA